MLTLLSVVNITASENFKIVESEYWNNSIYFIDNEGVLWSKENPNNEFIKVIEFDEKIKTMKNNYILLDDGRLYFKFLYREDTTLVASDVKEIINYNSDFYIIKNDNKLYEIKTSVNNFTSEIEVVIDYIAEDVKDINIYFDFFLVIMNNGDLYDYEVIEKPVKIMENVLDIKNKYHSYYVLDLDGTLYYVDSHIYDESEEKVRNIMLKDVKEIELMNGTLFALKEDNTLWYSDNDYKVNEVGTLEKVGENVIDFTLGYDFCLLVKEDGTLWVMGDNSEERFGNIPLEYVEEYDENGFYTIMDNVKYVELIDSRSLVIKEDNSLWAFGENSKGEIISGDSIFEMEKTGEVREDIPLEISEPTKIADNVNYATFTEDIILYTTGENDDLYFNGFKLYRFLGSYYLEHLNEMPEEFTEKLLYNLYIEFTDDHITFEEFNKDRNVYLSNLPDFNSEIYDEIFLYIIKSTNDYYKENPVATNVKMVKDNFYLSNNNELYKFIGGVETKLAENIIDFEVQLYGIVAVNTDNQLVYATFNDYEELNEFFPFGINDVVDVNYGGLIFMKSDGSVLTDSLYFKTIIRKDEKIIEPYSDEDFDILVKDVLRYDIAGNTFVYIDSNNVLWGLWDNTYNQLGYEKKVGIRQKDLQYEYDNLYKKPIKIMEDVKMAVTDGYSTLVLKNDGTLIGMGANMHGELGFEGLGHSRKNDYIFNPVQLEIKKSIN